MGLFGLIRSSTMREEMNKLRTELTSQLTSQITSAKRVGFASAVRAFNGASPSRLLSDWKTTETQVDQIIRSGGPAIRERARDLVRNSDHAKRFVKLCRTNILNQSLITGFQLQPWSREAGPTGEWIEYPEDDRKILNMWNDWAKPENCSVNGRQSLRGIADLMIQSLVRDGEAFVRLVRRKKTKYGLVLQIIPPEMVDENYNAKLGPNSFVKMGVEVDLDRRPIAYHVKVPRPETEVMAVGISMNVTRERIPASEIIHIFDQEYENQTRGISWMVQSMVNMHMAGKYDFAALVNATVAASKVFWIIPPVDGSGSKYEGQSKDADGNAEMDLEAGSGEELAPGSTVQQFNPNYPDQQHEMFDRSLGRKMAMGLGVSYASLTGDLSQANYGSNRVGMLEEREIWKQAQQMMVERVMNRLYADILEMAWLKSLLNIPSPYLDRYASPHFIGRIWGWIDPEKDITAKKESMGACIETLTQTLGERGITVEEQVREIAQERKLFEDAGITLDFTMKPKAPAAPPNNQDPANEGLPVNGKKKTNGAMVATN